MLYELGFFFFVIIIIGRHFYDNLIYNKYGFDMNFKLIWTMPCNCKCSSRNSVEHLLYQKNSFFFLFNLI